MLQESITNLQALLSGICPKLNSGTYAFCLLNELHGSALFKQAIASVRESEGLTLVLEESEAIAAGLVIEFRAVWITLEVHSDLAAVGFTAAFSKALADEGIACNVFAGIKHDHLFVAVSDAERAVDALNRLSQSYKVDAT